MKGFVFILLGSLQAFNVQAESVWLKEMVALKEKGVKPTPASIKPSITKPGFFSQHGLVLFYASTCPHCHELAPVLKAFAEKNQAKVLPLSFDNKPLAEFPHFLPATTEWVNAAFKGQAINYPALFIANPKKATLYPAAFGSMTEGELSARMDALIAKIIDYETKGIKP